MSAPVDVIVLCGGKGTRLASVIGNVPKPLAQVGGSPFLDRLLSWLVESGRVNRLLLAAGHLGEQVHKRYETADIGALVEVMIEDEPLGTGGAIRNALPAINTPTFIVVNGDSFTNFLLGDLLDAHYASEVDGTIVTTEITDVSRYGSIEIVPATNRIVRFAEKASAEGPGLVSCGIYAFNSAWALREFTSQKFSIEEFFSANVTSACFSAFVVKSEFIDIGTPESFAQSQNFFKQE
jgi:D-glycero-alpha-D-manno-heptose 1-phosphate guanylyltransferase